MAKNSINQILKTSKMRLCKTLRTSTYSFSSIPNIYLTHLLKNNTNTEKALNKIKYKIDTKSVKDVLNNLKPNHSILGLRFFIWASTQSYYTLNSYLYNQTLVFFQFQKYPNLVYELFNVYKQEGIFVTSKMFQIVLNLCGEAKLDKESLWVLSEMKEFNVMPDVTAYNVVIKVLCEKGNVDVCLRLLGDMKLDKLYPNMVTFVTIIKGFSNLGRFQDAFTVFNLIKENGCVPNLVAYSALLHGLCKFGKLEKALVLLDEMEKDNEDCRPNVVSYTTVIQGFCERGMSMQGLSVFDRMMAFGGAPNRVTVSVLVKGLCNEGLLEEGYKFVERVGSQGWVGVGECYSSLVISLMRIGKFKEAEKLFRTILASGVKPDGLASSKMLKWLCSNGKALDAFCLYNEIEKSGYLVSVDSDIYSILLDSLCRENCLAEVTELARLCADKNIQLKAPYMGYIIEYLKRCGKEEIVSLLSSIRK